VEVASPKSERSTIAAAMPELLTVGIAESSEGDPIPEGWSDMAPHIESADALLIGSGLKPNPATGKLLLKILEEVDKPIVADAGALSALAGHLDVLRKR